MGEAVKEVEKLLAEETEKVAAKELQLRELEETEGKPVKKR